MTNIFFKVLTVKKNTKGFTKGLLVTALRCQEMKVPRRMIGKHAKQSAMPIQDAGFGWPIVLACPSPGAGTWEEIQMTVTKTLLMTIQITSLDTLDVQQQHQQQQLQQQY